MKQAQRVFLVQTRKLRPRNYYPTICSLPVRWWRKLHEAISFTAHNPAPVIVSGACGHSINIYWMNEWWTNEIKLSHISNNIYHFCAKYSSFLYLILIDNILWEMIIFHGRVSWGSVSCPEFMHFRSRDFRPEARSSLDCWFFSLSYTTTLPHSCNTDIVHPILPNSGILFCTPMHHLFLCCMWGNKEVIKVRFYKLHGLLLYKENFCLGS